LPPSKMPVRMLTQWKLVGAIVALLFVVSAVAISLNHRSKISSATANVGQPVAEPPSQPSPPVAPAEATPPDATVDLPQLQVRSTRPRGHNAGPAPAPASVADGQLTISSTPDGATITVEGRTADSWRTPQTLGSLAPAVYRVTLSKNGYASETRMVEVT